MSARRFVRMCTGIALAIAGAPLSAHAANWSVTRVNHMTLTPPGGVSAMEMSGVTYVGPVGGNHRFIAAEEIHGAVLQFDVTLSAAGAITAISNVASIPISSTRDFEGIAYSSAARHSVFASHEDIPGVMEFDLATGAVLQEVAIPSVFTTRRANFGFESLARTLDDTVMWTANEQALTVDGGLSTSAAGTTVRLLKLNVAGNAVTAGPQYAYVTEPIHGTSTFGSPQSGLSDLAVMPDGTLLALERSVSFLASPSTYLNRIYEIDLHGATDVSTGPHAAGLIGQSYTPVAKQLLWSGAADGALGQNLEGLTLGPQLANGSWVLLGVVDDGNNNGTDDDPLSGNTVVAFTATAIPSADFDADGDVDGADFLAWQRGVGVTVGAGLAAGDADRNGGVDGADLAIWESQFASANAASAVVPEPSMSLLALAAVAMQWARSRRISG